MNFSKGRSKRYLYIDASYFKVRDSGRYVNKALLIVTGVRDDGYREILGARIADSEDEGFWSSFFDELKERGLKGVKLVISDGHKGIQSAVQKAFLGASWQMCQVHFCRAVLKNIPNKDQNEVSAKLRDALEDEIKIQDLALELNQKRYSNPLIQSTGSVRIFGATKPSINSNGGEFEPPTG